MNAFGMTDFNAISFKNLQRVAFVMYAVLWCALFWFVHTCYLRRVLTTGQHERIVNRKWMNEWMMFLLMCDKKQTKSQLSPTHASTKRKITVELKHKKNASTACWLAKREILFFNFAKHPYLSSYDAKHLVFSVL